MAETKDTKKTSSGDLGQAEAQKKYDADKAKGYHGEVPDKTPNSHYTVAGVLAGKPTPENSAGKKK